MKIPTRKELQARHAKAVRHCKALDIAITELMLVAAAMPSVVHPTYSEAAMKALKKIEEAHPNKEVAMSEPQQSITIIISDLEAILSKVSPGEWRAIIRNNDGRDQYSIMAANPEEYRKRVGTMFIAHTPNNHCYKSGFHQEIEANAKIIARSTTVIPMLLKEIQRLKAKCGE